MYGFSSFFLTKISCNSLSNKNSVHPQPTILLARVNRRANSHIDLFWKQQY